MIAEMYLDLLNFTENAKIFQNCFQSKILNNNVAKQSEVLNQTTFWDRKYTLSNMTLFDDTTWDQVTANRSRNKRFTNNATSVVSKGWEKYSKHTFSNTVNMMSSNNRNLSHSNTKDSKVILFWNYLL